jgi:ferrous iron transport protein A
MIKSLAELQPHTKATIHSITDDAIDIKFMEMGFVPGEGVLLEIVAPLGDPLSIMIGGYNLSIRKAEANKIMVELKD